MDLSRFTGKEKKEEETKRELILDNDEIRITKIGKELEFIVKKESALEKYQDYMFMAPTHSIITDSNEKAGEFFQKSKDEGVEGLMFKNLSSSYKPGLRAGAMAKLKETKEDIDLVILGAEHGKGKRAGFYSSFIVGVRNDDYTDENDQYLMVGKVSSGIKELGEEGASMQRISTLLEPLKIKEEKSITYFEPKIVIQVRYQEIQKSTAYDSGYALRFPRIIALREDKDLLEINTIEDLSRFLTMN